MSLILAPFAVNQYGNTLWLTCGKSQMRITCDKLSVPMWHELANEWWLPCFRKTFYARFESNSPAVEFQEAQEDGCPPVLSRADVWKSLNRINTRKAPGPDGIRGRALKVCADQLADVLTDIFNLSLLQSVVPACFKETIIVPVPKKTKILCLNNDRPVALTSTIMKCFERLVKPFITSFLPDSLDPLQFAYRPNRSTADAISLTLHTALSHLDQRDICENAVHWLQFSIQYHRAPEARHQAQRPRAQHRPPWLDSELPDRQTTGGVDRKHHILHSDSKHRCPPGLRAQSSPVLHVHALLRGHPQLQHHR